MNLESLTHTSGEWLRGTGPDSDVVISSRVRLARNLSDFPFPGHATPDARKEVEGMLREQLHKLPFGDNLLYLDVDQLPQLDRQFLVERQLISREHADSHGTRGVGIGPLETVSLMINEEDHLRMQVLRSGYALSDCWDEMNQIDDQLEQHVAYAYDENFGYLTSCPTNAGTGIRASVMLHLPGLVLTKEIQKVFQAMQKMTLAVRGLYGEGSQAMGDFYQISNQMTLGKSEDRIIAGIQEVVPRIVDYERRVRAALVKENREKLHDQVSRAFAILRGARTITSQETMQHLSNVRMGINLGLVDDVQMPTVHELFIHTQPAHLQKIRKAELSTGERNIARAAYLRERLGPAPHQEN